MAVAIASRSRLAYSLCGSDDFLLQITLLREVKLAGDFDETRCCLDYEPLAFSLFLAVCPVIL
jgi:hypothetical protein